MKRAHGLGGALVYSGVLLGLTGEALAQTPPPAPAATAPGAATSAPRPGRWFAHANLGVNAFTWVGGVNGGASSWVTPADRFILLQQLGGGYWVHPNIRVQLTLQFVETLSGLPQGQSALALMGAIPWVVYTRGRFFGGMGPLVAWQSGGKSQFDLGWFLAVGVTFPLGQGWALAAAVQGPVMFYQRLSVAVSPALVVSRRF